MAVASDSRTRGHRIPHTPHALVHPHALAHPHTLAHLHALAHSGSSSSLLLLA